MPAPTGLSLRARLYLVLGLALALVAASALLGWWQSSRLAGIAQSLYEDRLVPVDLLREIEHTLGAQHLGALLIAQAQQPDAAQLDSAGRRLADATRALWRRYLATRMAPAETALIARTQPGPFLPRTIEMGTYLGIRREGALVAMAGERLHPPGWTEISAVCTDPAVRGQGLATRLILAVAHGIRERGETPFLHTGARNTNAIRLYESLGFRLRRRTAFLAARVPERLPEAVS